MKLSHAYTILMDVSRLYWIKVGTNLLEGIGCDTKHKAEAGEVDLLDFLWL